MLRLAIVFSVTATGAVALTPAGTQEIPPAIEWLLASGKDPARTASLVGTYALDGSGVVAYDPLTLFTAKPATGIPAQEVRYFTISNGSDFDDRIAASAIVLSDTPPVCGKAVGDLGVDGGVASISSATDLAKLTRYAEALDDRGTELYTVEQAQFADSKISGFLTLPDGTRIPMSSSGYGDGGFSLMRLDDARGQPVALYIDFIGDREGEWIDPPPCANV